MGEAAARSDIRLWRDGSLGPRGVELLSAHRAGHRYALHFHEEYVVAVFEGGAARPLGPQEEVALPGSILIIPPGEPHTGEAASVGGEWSHRAFYPDAETIAEVAGDVLMGRSARAIDFGPASLMTDAPLARRIATLHRRVEARDGSPLARQQAFADAMISLIVRHARPRLEPRQARADRRAIGRAMDCARARFDEPELSVADLAAASGLSPFHFMRCFRATAGITAHAFLVQIRVHQARGRLVHGMPASEAALAVGFSDQSHLIRHFRAAFGVTPGRYAAETRKRSIVAA